MTEKQYVDSIQNSIDVLEDIAEENKNLVSDIPIKDITEMTFQLVNAGTEIDEIINSIYEYLTHWFAENKFGEIGFQSAVVQQQARETVELWTGVSF